PPPPRAQPPAISQTSHIPGGQGSCRATESGKSSIPDASAQESPSHSILPVTSISVSGASHCRFRRAALRVTQLRVRNAIQLNSLTRRADEPPDLSLRSPRQSQKTGVSVFQFADTKVAVSEQLDRLQSRIALQAVALRFTHDSAPFVPAFLHSIE